MQKFKTNSLWFAVTLQCLGKLYSGSVYSGKQRNIYEHIYKFISPFTENPPYIEHTVA